MPTGTEDLVRSVIDGLRDAAASGSSTAISDLASKAGSGPPAAAKEPAEVPLQVPDRVIPRPNGEGYHVRKIGAHDDVALMRVLRAANVNVMAYGLPGTGKTALIEAAYAAGATAVTVYTIQGTGDTEVADFVGGYYQDAAGRYVWEDGPLIKAMEEGAVLYIDEIALIDPKVLALLFGVMDGRDEIRITQNPERGIVKAAAGFYVVSACNPNAPGARMSEALLSRFSLQIEVTTDYELARTLGVLPDLLTAAQNLERKRVAGDISWSPQLRELLDFKQIAGLAGRDVALRNLISTAPELDRATVRDIISRKFSKKLTTLTVD